VAATLRHRPARYASLDLPRPWRSAGAFGALVVVALLLDAAPTLPWVAGAFAALLFGTAGCVRTLQTSRDLAAVRRAADRLIVHSPTSRDASALVRWRSEELTCRAQRERLRREVGRTLRSLDPLRLPSSSPLRRADARRDAALFDALAARLADERAIAARGVLLAQALLRDPASPLYSDGPEQTLAHTLRRVLGALEP
jgi:hypothetical protein